MHTVGILLVEEHEGVPLLRFVAKGPRCPGDSWIFVDSPECANVPSTCLPSIARATLSADALNAMLYIRDCRAKLREPNPEEYASLAGIGAVAARQRLADAAASGLVDYRGCEACPAWHLCSRERR